MKIFQSIQKNMRPGGLTRDQPPLNKVQKKQIFKCILFLILQFVYFFHVANTPRQYMDSIFVTTAGLFGMVSYISVALKTPKIFDYIDAIEEMTIDQSRCLP